MKSVSEASAKTIAASTSPPCGIAEQRDDENGHEHDPEQRQDIG